MKDYAKISYQLSEKVTRAYSTSFSMSSSLFDRSVRKHVYAIYGLVRIADEIVDTYMGPDAEKLLNDLEAHVLDQLKSQQPFSPNPIVQAFVLTAQKFAIDTSLVRPFFDSMRTDLTATHFSKKAYDDYIYGSAEVIGLMCLKIFTNSDTAAYELLKPGALGLGRAYQKVNFLRDMKSDFEQRGRVYFPGVEYETFNTQQKAAIEADIEKDFLIAAKTIKSLPKNSRKAVQTSYDYYWELFVLLRNADVKDIISQRLSVATTKKLALYAKAKVLGS